MMGNPKIMELRIQAQPLISRIHKLVRNLNLKYRNILVAVSQINNGESENHGTFNSGPTLKTPEFINCLKNGILLYRKIFVALSQIDDGESEKHGTWNPELTL